MGFKARIVHFAVESNNQSEAARLYKVERSMVSKWVKARDEILQLAAMAKGKKGRGKRAQLLLSAPRGPTPKFPAAEALVLSKFVATRARGVPVGGRALMGWMVKAVKEAYPNVPPYEASRGWLQRFMGRHNLRPRSKTNKKAKSVEERLPQIKAFHKSLQAFVSADGGDNHPVTGFYAPQNVYNVDQSPIVLQESSNTTLEFEGATTVRVSTKESGDKRYATLQIVVRLCNGVPQPLITVIFRGQGKRISAEERNGYDKRVTVLFQPKAWVNEEIFLDWIDAFAAFKGDSKVLLFMDNLSAQQTDPVRNKLASKGIKAWYLPPNCTDIVQPVDRNLAQQVKMELKRMLETRLADDETFANAWLGVKDGVYPAWRCRVLLTELVGAAWESVCKTRDFERLGFETGCLMVKAGLEPTESQRIKIVGVDSYSFQDAVVSAVASADVGGPAQVPLTDADKRGIQAFARENVVVEDSDDETDSPAVDSNEEDVIEQELPVQSFQDETAEPVVADLVAPPGWAVVDKPEQMWSTASILNSSVLWLVDATQSGVPGWIRSEVLGGPPDPKAAAQGITMRLRCNKRIDAKTPPNVIDKDNGTLVAFTLDNYGKRWVMLKQAAAV